MPTRLGGGVSASILLRGEGRVIKGGGVLRRKNLQISDLQRLASLQETSCNSTSMSYCNGPEDLEYDLLRAVPTNTKVHCIFP